MSNVLRHLDEINAGYECAKKACREDWTSAAADRAIRDLVQVSLRFLAEECARVEMVSYVLGKQYYGYARTVAPDVVSRPVNKDLFVPDISRVTARWGLWDKSADTQELAQVLYTAALAPCLAMELFDRNNKKGPATYFEHFIGYLFAHVLGIAPRKQATFSILGKSVSLTMDFLFDVDGSVGLHLPVKMSTRERVIQAWAHQRMLDAYYGDGAYAGVLVVFSETKLDSRSLEVIEICVPDQWFAYQALLTQMDRIYYFDLPQRYRELSARHPDALRIRPFAEFFTETEAVVPGRLLRPR